MLQTSHGVLTATGPGNGCRNGRAAQPIKFTLTREMEKNYKYWPMILSDNRLGRPIKWAAPRRGGFK